MSVIVKGMKFPENCSKCNQRTYNAGAGEECCPFAQVLCLQDADDLLFHMTDRINQDIAQESKEEAPTILEAEGVKE